ncbi:MAG: trehalose-phosphatase, partial [Actinomycetota bacterium]|nr:trehalose-phosphatase [Actinomycetota bacterium]
MKLPVFVDSRYHDAVIFDVEGVVADTAALHTAAWKATLDDHLGRSRGAEGRGADGFTDADYQKFLAGRPEAEGIAEFLAAHGITLPAEPSRDGHDDTVAALVARARQLCAEMLTEHGVRVFESTVEFAHRLREAGIATAVYASQCDCARILDAAGLTELFDVRVDAPAGHDGSAAESYPGVLREAVARLGVQPRRCVVIADAEAGMRAARDGGFGLVIGVDRFGHAGELRRCGADTVVGDVVSLTVRDTHRRISELADALESYSDIAPLAETRRPVVLLDFDGTLSEIVNDPDAATLLPGAEAMLRELAAHCPVAVISGRSLADIRARVAVPGLWYAGSHGFELVAPDGARHQNEAGAAAVEVLGSAVTELRDRLAGIDGVLIEDKRFSVAVHYRNVADERVDEVIAAVRVIGQRANLPVTGGRMVIELRPDVDWDKGRTVDWILDRIDGEELMLPIYIGDDLTDEDGFDAIRNKGIGVAVRSVESGDRRSAARFA